MHRVQRRLAGGDVRLGSRDPPGPLEDLPEQEQGEIDRYAHIGRDEIVQIKALGRAGEDVEAVEQCDEREEDETEPCRVWLESRLEDEGVAVDTLCFERGVELDVGDGDGHPGEEVGDGGQVLEPGEDSGGAGRAGHVCQEGDGGGDEDAVVWDTPGDG